MKDAITAEAPQRTRPTAMWVPVRDARGHVRMEMRWVLPDEQSRRAVHAA